MPTGAGKENFSIRQSGGGFGQEFRHARLAFRGVVIQEAKIGLEMFFRRHGKVQVRIECVVNGDAFARAECRVGIGDGRAAAARENEIVFGKSAGGK